MVSGYIEKSVIHHGNTRKITDKQNQMAWTFFLSVKIPCDSVVSNLNLLEKTGENSIK